MILEVSLPIPAIKRSTSRILPPLSGHRGQLAPSTVGLLSNSEGFRQRAVYNLDSLEDVYSNQAGSAPKRTISAK